MYIFCSTLRIKRKGVVVAKNVSQIQINQIKGVETKQMSYTFCTFLGNELSLNTYIIEIRKREDC